MDIEIKKIETDIIQIENEIKQSQLKLNILREQRDSFILIKSLQDDFIICFECNCKIKKTELEDDVKDVNTRIKKKLKIYCNLCHNSDYSSDDGYDNTISYLI
jgi:hypothetical protein